jgi:DNA-binding NtrC family response regulator
MNRQLTTILVIDDDPLHLKIYCWILQREGYRCRTALVESRSVDLPADERIDLVLLDYRLTSSLTAPEIARNLKTNFPSVPIVVLSEMPWMPEDMTAHAVGFINKGNPQRLLNTVADVLGSGSSAA